MKKMITAVAAVLLSAAAFAQTASPSTMKAAPVSASTTNESAAPAANRPQRVQLTPEQRAKRETDNINSMVPLGAAYDKVQAVNVEFATKKLAMKGEIKNSGAGITPEQKAQMKTLNDDHRKSLSSAMGPDLFAKYEAAVKAKRDERKAERNQPGGPAPTGK